LEKKSKQFQKNEVARLSEDLATKKIKPKSSELGAKEKEVRLLSVERRLREELQATTQKLNITMIEAEKNLLFFEEQAKVHVKIKNSHLEDLSLIEKGRVSEVEDLRREINELKGKIVLLEGDDFSQANTCVTSGTHPTERKGNSRDDIKHDDGVQLQPGDHQRREGTALSTLSDEIKFGKGSLTQTDITRVQEIQLNLEVIATLVFCYVNGKIPENKLLQISSGEDISRAEGVLNEETGLTEQKRPLTGKDVVCFKNSINNLRLDVQRLRAYITKKYAGELTEQCYVQ